MSILGECTHRQVALTEISDGTCGLGSNSVSGADLDRHDGVWGGIRSEGIRIAFIDLRYGSRPPRD